MTQLLSDTSIIVAYRGPFSIQIISSFGDFIKAMPIENSSVKKKLFKTFLEAAQNISYYSAQKFAIKATNHVGEGSFILKDETTSYTLTTKNKIHESDAMKLTSHCIEINKLDFVGLRSFKNCFLKKKSENEKDNSAHIGLIQMALISSNKLDFTIDYVENYFELTIRIKKTYS